MARAVQLAHAFNDDPRRAGAGNSRAHLVEAVGDIANFGLARRVADDGGSFRECRRHQRDMRAADRHLGKIDLGSLQARRRPRNHITRVDHDLGAEFFQRQDQEVDRTRPDCTAARQ